MTSAAQLISNRANAAHSTGPRTSGGKLRSAGNAPVVHGLASERLLALPSEDPEELRQFAEALRNDLAPEGALEAVLVDRIVCAAWRLRRAGVYEVGIVRAEAEHDPALAFFRDANKGDVMGKLGRYVREAETSLRSNQNLLERLQARRRGEVVPVPVAVDVTVTADPAQPPA